MDVEDLLCFPSLQHELELEHKLFGSFSQRLANWLQRQLDCMHDEGFARLFSDNIDCFEVQPNAYNHRFVETKDGALLAGIRFFGLDVKRPFVEVIAHNFPDLEVLKNVVRSNWSVFAPQSLRLTVPANSLPTPDAVLDVSIHAAPYDQMQRPDGRVVLSSKADMQIVEQLVAARYATLADQQGELARNISASSVEELQECFDQQSLYLAHLRKESDPMGMICVDERAIGWLEGEQVIEEVVVAAKSGNGFAAQMQMEMAAIRCRSKPDCLLIGTIDRLNHASRKSAQRAGRPEVMRRVFLPLQAA